MTEFAERAKSSRCQHVQTLVNRLDTILLSSPVRYLLKHDRGAATDFTVSAAER